jgi:hypothetical protein
LYFELGTLSFVPCTVNFLLVLDDIAQGETVN